MVGDDFGVAFRIGPIAFSWYGILILSAFLIVLFVSYIEWRKKRYRYFDFYILFSVGAFFALFGARWWFLIFNPSDFQGFISIFWISSGRSILGSIFFVTIWILYYVNFHAKYLEFNKVISIILPNILIGQCIGRWGNFFQQDVYGHVLSNPWFLPNFISNAMYIDGFYRQPLFLYESIINLVGWILITFILKNIDKVKSGVHGSLYFVWYGLTRSSMELFRDPKYIMKIGNIPTSFVLSILILIIGIIMSIYYQYYFVNVRIMNRFFSEQQKQLFKNKVFSFLISFSKEKKKFLKEEIKKLKEEINLIKMNRKEEINLYVSTIDNNY